MRTGAVLSLWLLLTPLAQAAQHHLLIVGGIGGTDDYRQQFSAAATRLYRSAIEAGLAADNIALLNASPLSDPSLPRRDSDKSTLLQALDEIAARAATDDRVFVVLIGHGNPRGDGAAFNLPGPDITATELATALDKLANRLIVVVNSASASGPFVKPLSAANRVVISATSSGREYHATLFGEYFVAALAEPGADRDKDQRISMLEAFVYARREVERAYEREKKILIEHALLDDNGDGDGSSAPGELESDGALAARVHLQQPHALALGASPELVGRVQRRQELEQSITALKRRRDGLAHDDYYAQLERLLVDLALLSREIRALED
ncbi:MAG: C13 family peptidase [Gammaproteobacteria bacterium]|nr:C13 family peptidase [Gammaproteobacteria bacterium]